LAGRRQGGRGEGPISPACDRHVRTELPLGACGRMTNSEPGRSQDCTCSPGKTAHQARHVRVSAERRIRPARGGRHGGRCRRSRLDAAESRSRADGSVRQSPDERNSSSALPSADFDHGARVGKRVGVRTPNRRTYVHQPAGLAERREHGSYCRVVNAARLAVVTETSSSRRSRRPSRVLPSASRRPGSLIGTGSPAAPSRSRDGVSQCASLAPAFAAVRHRR
jgi:hypothetical protein